MPQVTGRSTEPRTVASVGTTNASAALTAPAGSFDQGDVGRKITGTGIPANATLIAVTATGNGATLSANATATGTITASLLAASNVSSQQGFVGWSPETEAEAKTYSIAGGASASAPDRITSPAQGRVHRSR